MIEIHKSENRGKSDFDWLESKHSFSFGHYYDPENLGFGALRVINEDKVKAGKGFGEHSHSNMEIISYVLSGNLEHKDSIGTGSIISSGDFQRMSAGSGIIHSEFNPSHDQEVHFLQIWIIPNEKNIKPSYEQKNFTHKRKSGKLTLIASKNGDEESLMINQNSEIFVLDLDQNQKFSYDIKPNEMVWVQITKGAVNLNDKHLNQGDGARIINEEEIEFSAKEKMEALIFNLKKD